MSNYTPQLRFPEFTDQWERVKLSDVAGKGKYGMNAAAKPYDGINKYLRITDIDDESRKILVDKVTSPSGTLDDSYLLKQNDIVLTRTGASTGKSYIYQAKDGKVYFAGFLIRFRVTRANPYFVYSQTLRQSYDKWIMTISARSGQPGVNAEEYGTYSFYLPQKPEQQKIADYLGVVDIKLTSIQARVAAMHEYKKGVMRALFSGKLRFKDENGNPYPDWEEKTIASIAYSETSPLSANQIEGKSGPYKVYGASGVLQSLDEYHYEEEYIAIVKDGAGVGRIRFCEPKSSVLGTMIVIQPKERTNKKFLYYLLNLVDFKKYTIGSTIPHVYFKQYSREKFNIPSTNEQQKIADFLTIIDEKIKLEEAKLANAKEFKNALLQRMFV